MIPSCEYCRFSYTFAKYQIFYLSSNVDDLFILTIEIIALSQKRLQEAEERVEID